LWSISNFDNCKQSFVLRQGVWKYTIITFRCHFVLVGHLLQVQGLGVHRQPSELLQCAGVLVGFGVSRNITVYLRALWVHFLALDLKFDNFSFRSL
jgi:hypothetical protein